MDIDPRETPVIPIRRQALKDPAEEPAKEPGRATHAAYALMQAGASALTRAWGRRRATLDKLKAWALEDKPDAEETPRPPPPARRDD